MEPMIPGPEMKSRIAISLRPVEESHKDLICDWKNDLEFAYLYLGTGKFLSRRAFRKGLNKVIKEAALAAMIFDDRTDTPIGFTYAYGQEAQRTSCSIAVFVAPTHRHRGAGPVAFALMARCLFFYNDFEKIKVSIAGWNPHSLETATHPGFLKHEGTEANELRLGDKAFPFIHLALFREDYNKLRLSPLWRRFIGN